MLYVLDLFGTAVFAATGALAAGRKHMDAFGVVVVALVTALGGGTLRDVLLGRTPVFWISDPRYIVLSVAAALLTFATAHRVRVPARALLIGDAVGLAVFTDLGCALAAKAGVAGIIVVLMGAMTGVAGGIVRDLLCGEIPMILRREVYATASLLGGLVFVALGQTPVPGAVTAVCTVAVVLVVRLAALTWNLSLPVFRASDGAE